MTRQVIFDITKVSYCSLVYINQSGSIRSHKPTKPSVYGEELEKPNDYARYYHDFPSETLIERATRLGVLDVWEPTLTLQFSNTHCLTFKGAKALSLWETWCGYIFSRNKTTKKKGKK